MQLHFLLTSFLSVSGNNKITKTNSTTVRLIAKYGGVKNEEVLVFDVAEKYAPIMGPKMKATEKATPTKA